MNLLAEKREKMVKVLQAVEGDAELKSFIENEIKSLDKMGKEYIEIEKKRNDITIMNYIHDYLLDHRGQRFTIEDLKERIKYLKDLTPQKISVLLNKLMKTSNVENNKNEDKKTVYYVEEREEQ